MMELSSNKLFFEKERKKEDDENHFFHVERFQTLVMLPQVLAISIVLAMLKNTW